MPGLVLLIDCHPVARVAGVVTKPAKSALATIEI